MATLGEITGWRKLTEEEIIRVRPVLEEEVKSKRRAEILFHTLCVVTAWLCVRGFFWLFKNLWIELPKRKIQTSDDILLFLVLIVGCVGCGFLGVFLIRGLIYSWFHRQNGKEALKNQDWIAMDVTFELVNDVDSIHPYGYIRDRNGQLLEGVIGRGKRIPSSIPSESYFSGPGLLVRVPADLYKPSIVDFVFKADTSSKENASVRADIFIKAGTSFETGISYEAVYSDKEQIKKEISDGNKENKT